MRTTPRRFFATTVFAAFGLVTALALDAAAAQQWRPMELEFVAETEVADPFDFEKAGFAAVITGPDNARLVVPGFWDGGRTWKIRFTPTRAGEWSYVTRFTDTNDSGLHGRRGVLRAGPPDKSNAVRKHGGFLQVSANRRYLTFSDGTPFFWLGDTWWAAPSANVPFDVFKRQVDARVAQGYTVFQAHGHRALFADSVLGAFEATRKADAETLRYWREVDKYFACADAKGLVGAMGFARGDMFDPFSLMELKRLWRYYIARYGAYAVTFLMTQEYNIYPDKREAQLPKLLALGRFIKETDPWKRALTAHPWVHSRDLRHAWEESWYDFIMLQAGHRRFAPAKAYYEIWQRPTPKPFIESEANYEGFVSTNFNCNASAIRRSAYTAIQAGSFGFTYGAQGLYGGVLDRKRPGPTANWGPVLTWDEGLKLPGGAQLQHLRACYESVEWWKLEPVPGAVVPTADILVKADDTKTLLVYFPPHSKAVTDARLVCVAGGVRYEGEWFDPRTGCRTKLDAPLTAQSDGLSLPTAPDRQDWMLILKRK